MGKDEHLRAIRDIIQVDIGDRGLARDPVDNLLTAFPNDFADACYSIARHLSPRVGIITGFMIPSVDPPTGETDGPLGALFLASVLNRIGVPCVLLSDAASLNALDVGRRYLHLDDHPVVPLIPLPMESDSLFAPDDISHLIALERSGPSHSTGRNYTMRGRDITEWTAPAHLLFEMPRKYVTIGIGDGGNEIGMGKIPLTTIAKNIPNGETIACRTAVDYLIVAGVSNWGAYALAAGVMILKESIDESLFDSEAEFKLLERIVQDGPLIDGVTAQRTATVDGRSFEEYAKPFDMIRNVLAR